MLNTIHECNVDVFVGYSNSNKFCFGYYSKLSQKIKKKSLVWLISYSRLDRIEHEIMLTRCDFLFQMFRYSKIEDPIDILNAAFTTNFHLRSR